MIDPAAARKLLEHNVKAHDTVADLYDAKHREIFNPLEQKRLAATVSELLALVQRPSPQVLDVGAGTGNLTLRFLAEGCRVCAADVSRRSLDQLERKVANPSSLTTRLIVDERLPFPDASFDIAAAYSVLHHIPDYLRTVREMVRVLRPGGLVFVDHEFSAGAWRSDPVLDEYRALTRLPLWEHARDLIATREAFTFSFAKTVFMMAFVNRRYKREGDIHVWPDDHIEWDEVEEALRDGGARIVASREYLHYEPRGGEALYAAYKDRCSNLRLIFARKD
jgi:ubiquinone/menaquinone biosynthesis C-methylase UbiE